MPRILPDPNAGYPPRWHVFDHHVAGAGCAALGFSGTTSDVNRFAARYRASFSFKHIVFENLTASTASGYSELCHLLLAYSAFEYYLKALGLTIGNADSLISVHERAQTLTQLRALDGHAAYFRLVQRHTSKNLRYQIGLYLTPRVCNPFCLAAAARHAFAHGTLTPNPAGFASGVVQVVTQFLHRAVMRVMERDFEQRMSAFEGRLQHP